MSDLGFAVIAVKTGDAVLGGAQGPKVRRLTAWEGNGFEVSVPRRERDESRSRAGTVTEAAKVRFEAVAYLPGEDECRRRGIKRLELSTAEIQAEALALYRSAGYRPVREEFAERGSSKTVGSGMRRFLFRESAVTGTCTGLPTIGSFDVV